jgi:glycogen synthase
LCFGDQVQRHPSMSVDGVQPPVELRGHDPRHTKFFATMMQDLVMSARLDAIDIVHCHTWYTHLAGCLTRFLHDVPLVLTTHSLEPHRPWKVEQLGAAYFASSWIERTAYQNADGVVAVSQAMRADVQALYGVAADRVRVIHNGIDLQEYRPIDAPGVLAALGVDPAAPYVLFVGRITRQKGIVHLVDAIQYVRTGVQVVLCAGAPDTGEIAREMAEAVERARASGTHRIVWIPEMLPKPKVIALYSHAAVFVCPSVYEPFGIINLEAMACETPVVASAVGGIPEIVDPGETGLLVPVDPRGPDDGEPRDPDAFHRRLAEAVNRVLDDPEVRTAMGRRARQRVERDFGWPSIARRTLEFYQELVERKPRGAAGPDR